MRKHTGLVIRGVAPVGHSGILQTFIECTLAHYPEIWAAAGHPHTVFRLTYPELVRITAGSAVDVAAEA